MKSEMVTANQAELIGLDQLSGCACASAKEDFEMKSFPRFPLHSVVQRKKRDCEIS